MVDIVEEEHVDVVVDHMVETKQVETTRNQVEDEVTEAEVEADIDMKINHRYNAIIVINMVITATTVDPLQRTKIELM